MVEMLMHMLEELPVQGNHIVVHRERGICPLCGNVVLEVLIAYML
jgi:hypothetical protein